METVSREAKQEQAAVQRICDAVFRVSAHSNGIQAVRTYLEVFACLGSSSSHSSDSAQAPSKEEMAATSRRSEEYSGVFDIDMAGQAESG
mmetsp:Transcript_92441/g.146145  ORF Transcript_92441/g.146145 Transcript_92441/m.146145 type:complete len:90 (-) Transcript_92441:2081-2350(-)